MTKKWKGGKDEPVHGTYVVGGMQASANTTRSEQYILLAVYRLSGFRSFIPFVLLFAIKQKKRMP
jgi:hypothetical protein